MTTIAYRDGVLAADSRATYENMIVPGNDRKLHAAARRGRATIAAYTGASAFEAKLLDWLDNNDRNPPPDGSGTMVLMESREDRENPTFHELWVVEDGALYEETADFMAWGSGAAYALAAMHCGADAAEAVRIASLCDAKTAGPILTGRFDSEGRIAIAPVPAPASPPSRTA